MSVIQRVGYRQVELHWNTYIFAVKLGFCTAVLVVIQYLCKNWYQLLKNELHLCECFAMLGVGILENEKADLTANEDHSSQNVIIIRTFSESLNIISHKTKYVCQKNWNKVSLKYKQIKKYKISRWCKITLKMWIFFYFKKERL
jgi:hypothetical protein